MKNILIYAEEPGGVNVLIPIVKELNKTGNILKVYGNKIAKLIFEKNSIECNQININSKEDAKKAILVNKAKIIITGTSGVGNGERLLWMAGKECVIKSYAIVDQWMNLEIRFSKNGVNIKDKKEKKEFVFPNTIFLMDDKLKDEAIKLGIKSENIKVVGHPYLEWISKTKKGIKPKKNEILFASEKLSEDFIEIEKGAIGIYGYDEISILQNIVNLLKDRSLNYTLVIRKHPRECWDSKIRKIKNLDKINWRFDNESDVFKSINRASIIIGMSSMLLLEAIALNKKVLSVEIGAKGSSNFMPVKYNLMKGIFSKEELEDAFINLDKYQMNNKLLYKGSINKIINELEVEINEISD